jgi:hypothetical protein
MTVQEVIERAEQRARAGAPTDQAASIAGHAASRNAQRDLDVALAMFGAVSEAAASRDARRGH